MKIKDTMDSAATRTGGMSHSFIHHVFLYKQSKRTKNNKNFTEYFDAYLLFHKQNNIFFFKFLVNCCVKCHSFHQKKRKKSYNENCTKIIFAVNNNSPKKSIHIQINLPIGRYK